MGFLNDKVRSARERQKQALITEAGRIGGQVVDISQFGDDGMASGAAIGGSLTAMFGGRMQVDWVQVFHLQTNGWPHAYAQPYSGFNPLPGEHHTSLAGSLAGPAILREALRHSDHPWDPAPAPAVAQHLTASPLLRKAIGSLAWDWAIGLTKVTLEWGVQLRSVGNGSTHVVMQAGRYGGLTTYEVGFAQWLTLCQALHGCLAQFAAPAQAFVTPARYAEAVNPAYGHVAAPEPAAATAQAHIDYGPAIAHALGPLVGKKVWVGANSIPAKKLANIQSNVLPPQLARSPILAAIDLTVFGSAKDAIVVTPTHLVVKEFDDRLLIELATIRAVPEGQSALSSKLEILVDRLGSMQLPTGTDDAPIRALARAIAQANGAAAAPPQPHAASDQINAAARLLMSGEYQAAIDAYLAIAHAAPETTGTCYSQVGAALFFMQQYGRAIEYYQAAKQHGADVTMMDENIAEAQAQL